MATSPKKGVKRVRFNCISVRMDAMGYPNTSGMDTDYRYPHQSCTDDDRLV